MVRTHFAVFENLGKPAGQRWLLICLTACTFFLLLGVRGLNEPDEGRYSEIAREMVETGDWVVPHFWYLPHCDKPPLTYWLVAASLTVFGQNEWAVRLPIALAGLSGVWATFLLACLCGGRRVGFWAALILQTSLLYFVMARMLTTDIFLTQFITWAIYFFWRGWRCPPARSGEASLWHMAGWVAIALGFLTKGPLAMGIPLIAFAAWLVGRRGQVPSQRIPVAGVAGGLVLFLGLVLPWFLMVFHRYPEAAHFMIVGQAVGHFVGTIKNRHGSPVYFFAIVIAGLAPWTLLLGWLWRRRHWRGLDAESQAAWRMLSAWVIFTFIFFSLSGAKLPAYILPIFPALAVLLAWRFFGTEVAAPAAPLLVWRLCLLISLLLPALFPLLVGLVSHNPVPAWLKWQSPAVAVVALVIFWRARHWSLTSQAVGIAGLAWLGFMVVVAEVPQFEINLRANQTLKPLGLALRAHFQPGDVVVCWGKLPQGLPFYAGTAISAENRPYLGGMDLTQVPFEFPGNRDRLGQWLLPNKGALADLLHGHKRVWIVSFGESLEPMRTGTNPVFFPTEEAFGQWTLSSNR